MTDETAEKIKDALKLKRCNINDAIRNNNFLFLHGIYTSDFSYRNFISEIFDSVDNEMIFLYDYMKHLLLGIQIPDYKIF